MLGALRALPRSGAVPGATSGLPELARVFSSIPIVDVSALTQPDADPARVKSTADTLYQAAKNVGFFYCTDHGVPAELCERVLNQASDWFQLPADIKQEINLTADRHYRGYQGLGANVTRYKGGFARDHHEGLDFYAESAPSRISKIHGPNQWPSQLPELEAALREYVPQMLQLGHSLMRGITLGLLGAPGRLPGEPKKAEESYWCMRVINYPPLPGAEDAALSGVMRNSKRNSEIERSVQLSCGEHTDYGMLTMVNQQQDITALQVKNSADEWVDAPPVEGAFVCNIGDMLKLMSGGLLKPTLHRVLNNSSSKTRTSCAFFYEPAFDAMVQPAVSLRRLMPQWHGSAQYGAHLENKVFRNFEM